MKLILPSTLFFFLLLTCNQSTSRTNADQMNVDPSVHSTNNTMEKASPVQKPTDILKLIQRQVIDKEGTGLVASTYLLPSDWTVQDRLYWEYGDATVPVRFKAAMQSGNGDM